MEISLELCLPREAASVPVTRQMLDASLDVLGVEQPIRADIQVMLTEACTNVIRHAEDSDDFSVRAVIVDDRCLIKVLDRGNGFNPKQTESPDAGAEHGRGVLIMRALADHVQFSGSPEEGTLVALEKHLFYGEDTAGRFLTSPAVAHNGAARGGGSAPDAAGDAH